MKTKVQTKKVFYIKLSSLDDLCRLSCNFDYTNSVIMALKSDSSYRIFCVGEEINGVVIAYYISSAKKEKMLCYTYPSYMGQQEDSHFVEQGSSAQGSQYMNVINITNSNFKQASPKVLEKTMIIELSEPYDLVSAVIRSAVKHESIPAIYSFTYKEKRIICAFDAVEELSGEDEILYYAVMPQSDSGNFARYKYTENKVDFTDYMGEHSYMYAKIINLAEPFSFFRMPD